MLYPKAERKPLYLSRFRPGENCSVIIIAVFSFSSRSDRTVLTKKQPERKKGLTSM